MSEFLFDRRDVEFVLFDQLEVENLVKLPRYQDFSRELFEMVLGEAVKFAAGKLAPTNEQADAEGVRLEDGKVILPESYPPLYKEFCEGGWFAPVHTPDYGGQGLPQSVGMAAIEAFIAAHPSFMFFSGLTVSAGHLIEVHGTDRDVELYLEKMYTGEWGGTMCLTEPQAGSALGDLTTTATPVEGEDFYKIVGNKIFISAGDQNLTENIIHLVLARVPGDPEGSKGISLFIVPRERVNADGSIGESNDVAITGLEEKMGIHASPTCSISFGDNDECRGWLVGERCRGLQYMFQMMNEARLVTGLQGVAIGNSAYQSALAYAKERAQGPKVTDRSESPKSVAIIEHPDVRRNLMTMKAYGEALRAMLINTAFLSDHAMYNEDEAVKTKSQDMLDLLTPICKAFCSDMGFKMTEIAMQVFGGYGYIKEYGVEQKMRDVKIASIYEGTNGIQALDLLGRKMRMKNGGLFLTWLQDTNEFLAELSEDETLGEMAKQVDAAKNALGEAAFGFTATGKKDPEYPLLHATPYLRMFGLVESARLLLKQASIAQTRLEAIWAEKGVDATDDEARKALIEQNDDVRFYENKVKTASFFIYQILPEARAILKSIQSGDRSALDVAL
ncbi:acyl-CoA dehydrogenase [Lujinxingia vulgaris]|uniref:3-methylmercaptopropionyl-CoA dehydrogenase n=1 Tax=Lujinxingia vulgaris TaxID=2600176 RepID=A0A5C6X124_9DELT|nr:acyl-CoA dehydrogenase [Lujinxingia vulgaris]TXD33931.1 acyl-CoA dehydrogenase [Lujinxingia vulgaris]